MFLVSEAPLSNRRREKLVFLHVGCRVVPVASVIGAILGLSCSVARLVWQVLVMQAMKEEEVAEEDEGESGS